MPKKAYGKGSRKAMSAMKKRYGSRWKRVFYGRANKYGKGKSNAAKANSIYGKGKHRIRRSRKKR